MFLKLVSVKETLTKIQFLLTDVPLDSVGAVNSIKGLIESTKKVTDSVLFSLLEVSLAYKVIVVEP